MSILSACQTEVYLHYQSVAPNVPHNRLAMERSGIAVRVNAVDNHYYFYYIE